MVHRFDRGTIKNYQVFGSDVYRKNQQEVVVSKSKKTKLYEGKAKIIYSTDNESEVLIKFKDDATAFDGEKKGKIKGKGSVNNQMSSHLFPYLESHNVPTHFIEQISDTEMKCKKVDIIKVEVVMRNIAAGSLCKRYGFTEGDKLDTPILEYYLKDDDLHDPLMNDYHIYAMDLATKEEMQHISKLAIKINAVLSSYFQRRNILLVDFKLEFGRFAEKILLADEISPDTCRFWDVDTHKKLDKDRFRQDLGKVEEAYKEVLERVLT